MKVLFKSALVLATCVALLASCNDDEDTTVNTDPLLLCLPQDLQQGIIAAYPFSAGSLSDYAGTADLTASNAQSATDREGNTGCAYSFDGSATSYLTTQNTTFLNGLTAMSVSLWYQPVGVPQDYELLLGRGDGFHCPDTNGQWSVGLYDCRKPVFGHGNSVWDDDITNIAETGCEGEIAARTGVWHHLTVTYNQNNNELKIYRDGVLQNSESGFAGCGATPVVNDEGDLIIGKNFKGIIDDIAIYNKVLTTEEIDRLHDLDGCCQ
jgi:hypothetical protein